MLSTFTAVVLVTTVLFITRGPPQPRHDGSRMKPGRPHQGTTGSPHPSATQPTRGPLTLTLTPGPPKKATRAGAYAALATTSPGAQAQYPSTKTQRP